MRILLVIFNVVLFLSTYGQEYSIIIEEGGVAPRGIGPRVISTFEINNTFIEDHMYIGKTKSGYYGVTPLLIDSSAFKIVDSILHVQFLTHKQDSICHQFFTQSQYMVGTIRISFVVNNEFSEKLTIGPLNCLENYIVQCTSLLHLREGNKDRFKETIMLLNSILEEYSEILDYKNYYPAE